MKATVASLAAAAALTLGGMPAQAQQYAFTSKQVHVRAGPARDYPVVAVLPPRMQVIVFGCIPSYTWCDVAAGPDRGWVYAGNLLSVYENREVILPPVAAMIGIGIATFIIDDYWHEHYVERWWWPQRRRWYRPAPVPPIRAKPPVPQAAPRPPHVEGSPQDFTHIAPRPQPAQPAPPPRPQRHPPRSVQPERPEHDRR